MDTLSQAQMVEALAFIRWGGAKPRMVQLLAAVWPDWLQCSFEEWAAMLGCSEGHARVRLVPQLVATGVVDRHAGRGRAATMLRLNPELVEWKVDWVMPLDRVLWRVLNRADNGGEDPGSPRAQDARTTGRSARALDARSASVVRASRPRALRAIPGGSPRGQTRGQAPPFPRAQGARSTGPHPPASSLGGCDDAHGHALASSAGERGGAPADVEKVNRIGHALIDFHGRTTPEGHPRRLEGRALRNVEELARYDVAKVLDLLPRVPAGKGLPAHVLWMLDQVRYDLTIDVEEHDDRIYGSLDVDQAADVAAAVRAAGFEPSPSLQTVAGSTYDGEEAEQEAIAL